MHPNAQQVRLVFKRNAGKDLQTLCWPRLSGMGVCECLFIAAVVEEELDGSCAWLSPCNRESLRWMEPCDGCHRQRVGAESQREPPAADQTNLQPWQSRSCWCAVTRYFEKSRVKYIISLYPFASQHCCGLKSHAQMGKSYSSFNLLTRMISGTLKC